MILAQHTFRIFLSLIWLIAGVSKFRNSDSTLTAIEQLTPLRGKLSNFIARLLPLVEMSLSLALLWNLTRIWAASASGIVLLIFSVILSISLLRGKKIQCNCFGALNSSLISWGTVLRNVILMFLSVFCGVVSTEDSTLNQEGELWLLASLLAVFMLIVALLASSVNELIKTVIKSENSPAEFLTEVRWYRKTFHK